MQNMPVVTGVRKLIVPSGDSSVRPFQDLDPAARRPPEFSCVPRDYVPYPDDEIAVQLPPAEPTPPATSLLTIMMPVLGAILMVSFSVYAASMNSQSQSIPMFAFMSLPMALVSFTIGGVNYFRSRKKYKLQIETRQTRYLEYLKQKNAELTALAQNQREASLSAHPAMKECYQYACSLVPARLWERENGDPDFLDVRLGMGENLSTFSIKIAESSQFQVNPDPLEQQARGLQSAYARVPNVGVALPLMAVGAAGWVGKRDGIIDATRAFLLHLTAHHTPREVKVVVLTSEKEAGEWDWVRWLPHNWSDGREVRLFANSNATQASVLNYIETVLKQRQNQQINQDRAAAPIPFFVIIWADQNLWRGSDAVKFAPLVHMILENGRKLGAYSLFLAEQIARIPKECEAVVEVNGPNGLLKLLGTKPQKITYTPDYLDRSSAWEFAQKLAPVRLAEAGGGASNLPSTIPLLELIGAAKIDEVDVLALWKQSEPHKNLSVPIGIGAGGNRLFLNLHEKGHGPHGLVAGTTGSGKTALLSTYLALAALYYHPHELSFLGIDFKGGDLIRDLKDLPHMVGTMTNLDGQGTSRAIKILRGEIKKRQGLFNQAGIGNIYDYQKMHRDNKPEASQPMPHLVIVCDEFAELKKEQPDFIRELVSISRVGRSLGIHLILATQKPAGVISDEIWSNSHFHLCLKVASLEDSREMLRRPEAADITQQGRAYFQVGMNEVFELFQAAWGDAPYTPQNSLSFQPKIKQVFADGKRVDIWPPKAAGASSGKSQIQALADHICETARKNNIERIADIWPVTLSECEGLTLEDVVPAGQLAWDGKEWRNGNAKLQPVMGVKDDPERQRQDLLRVDLENDGHFVLFGGPGSGKTTCLQTLITSLALEHSPAEAHLYLIDYAGRNLTIFENLPHVGAVITQGENERLRRLLSMLIEEVERRKKLVENDQNLITYRKNHPNSSEPDLVVVLDGYSHFADAYKTQALPLELDLLNQIASQGGNLGIHLVMTTDQVKSFPAKLGSNIKALASLELNDLNDYISVVGRTGGLYPQKDKPGRGLVKGAPVLEFQSVQAAQTLPELKNLVETMRQSWQGKLPSQIPVIPDIVALSDLLPPGGVRPSLAPGLPVPLALNVARPNLAELQVSLNMGPHFWVSGLPQSGKTSLLQTWLLAMAECYSPDVFRFFLVDLGWGNLECLKDLPHSLGCISDAAELKTIRLQENLGDQINVDHSGTKPVAITDPTRPTVVFAVDGFNAFTKGLVSDMSDKEKIGEKNREYLMSLMRVKNARFHFMAAGMANEFAGTSSINPLGELLRGFQTGFWLGDAASDTTTTFNFMFSPSETKTGLPKGTSFFVNRGKYGVIKLATSHFGSLVINEWIERIVLHYQNTV